MTNLTEERNNNLFNLITLTKNELDNPPNLDSYTDGVAFLNRVQQKYDQLLYQVILLTNQKKTIQKIVSEEIAKLTDTFINWKFNVKDLISLQPRSIGDITSQTDAPGAPDGVVRYVTPYHEAVFYNDLKALNALLLHDSQIEINNRSHATNLDVIDSTGFTPLCYAALNNQHKMIYALIEHGASPTKHRAGCASAVEQALMSTDYHIFSYLLDKCDLSEDLIKKMLKTYEINLDKNVLMHADHSKNLALLLQKLKQPDKLSTT